MYGRYSGGLIDEYRTEGAEIILMAMGSVIGTIKDVVDEAQGVGVVKVRSFRPFPREAVRKALRNAKIVITLDKNISVGNGEGALCTEVKACLHNSGLHIPVQGHVLGLGGRDIPRDVIEKVISNAKTAMQKGIEIESDFIDLKRDLIWGTH